MSKFVFIIGAPKSATSSLADWLARHPECFFPHENKEPGFFRSNKKFFIFNAHTPSQIIRSCPNSPMMNLDAYLNLYTRATPSQWVLDASTDYLSSEGSVNRIKEFSNDHEIKLICILRDPIERACSEYRHTVRDYLEPLTFRESIEEEKQRIAAHYQPLFFHTRRSRYYDDLKQYQNLFGNDFMILDFETITNANFCGEEILEFIGINQNADLGPIQRLNASQIEKKPETIIDLLRNFCNDLRRIRNTAGSNNKWLRLRRLVLNNKSQMIISDTDRAFLFSLLKDDIEKCIADPSIPTDDWECKTML